MLHEFTGAVERELVLAKTADYLEYDVERDAEARGRLRALSDGQRNVPVLVEDGRVVQVGWQGRSCVIEVD